MDKRDYIHSLYWLDWISNSDFLFSGTGELAQGKRLATPGPRTAFFAVVWIKWMNIFRPAYFTLRHWREGGGGSAMSLSGQRAEWKESIRRGRREAVTRGEEIEGIQLCPSLHEFHRRWMSREEKDKNAINIPYEC